MCYRGIHVGEDMVFRRKVEQLKYVCWDRRGMGAFR